MLSLLVEATADMRRNCIVCGEPLYDRPLFVCRNMPSRSQNLPKKSNLSDDRPIDFHVCQCSGCGLVQLNCDPVPYYLDSTRAGERSEVLVNMRREQYRHMIETYHLQGKKIVEIGAGKGGFLKTLREMDEYGTRGYGIEYNETFVKDARECYGVNVVQGNPESTDWQMEEAPFDAFMSFAYPARLIKPNDMLRGVAKNLKDDGIGLVQVASLEHLLRPGGFYDITADHIAYYDRRTLRFLLERNGFDVIEEGETGGVYIYAYVKKRTPYDLQSIWSDVGIFAENVKAFVKKEKQENRKIGMWCAGHFAFTVLSTTGIFADIEYVIDNAGFKQGCFTPASHVPIVAPEHYFKHKVNTILVLAPFYSDEIVRGIRERYPEKIRIAVVDREKIEVCDD